MSKSAMEITKRLFPWGSKNQIRPESLFRILIGLICLRLVEHDICFNKRGRTCVIILLVGVILTALPGDYVIVGHRLILSMQIYIIII